MTKRSFTQKVAAGASKKSNLRSTLLMTSAAAATVMFLGSALPAQALTDCGTITANSFSCASGEQHTSDMTVYDYTGSPPTATPATGTVDAGGSITGTTYLLDYTAYSAGPTATDVAGTSTTYGNNTTATTTTDVGGTATLLDNGAIAEAVLSGNGITASIGGTAGDVFMYGGDALGTQVETDVTTYYDPTGTTNPANADNTTYGGNDVYLSTTSSTVDTPFGGDAAFTNTNGSVALVDEIAAGNLTFDNQATTSGTATITGTVSLSTTLDNGSRAIGALTEGSVNTQTHTQTSTSVTYVDVQTTVNTTNDSFTPTGGSIVASNSANATIGGGFDARGNGNTTFNNAGTVIGNVTVNSDPLATTSYHDSSITSDVVNSTPADTTTSGTVVSTSSTSNTVSGNGSGGETEQTTGGIGTFNNTATVGTSGSPVLVNVQGDTGAVLTNASGAEIYGTVSVASTPYSSAEGYSYSFTNNPGPGVESITSTTAPSSAEVVTVTNYLHTHADSNSSSTTYGAGSAALTNGGDINSANTAMHLQVGGGTVTLTNTGTIEASSVVVNGGNFDGLSLINTSHARSSTDTRSGNSTETNTDVTTATGESSSDVTDATRSHSTSTDWASTSGADTGSTASLANSGTIGLTASDTPVYVFGETVASLSNTGGTIYGDVNVQAFDVTTIHTGDRTHDWTSAGTDSSSDVTVTGTNEVVTDATDATTSIDNGLNWTSTTNSAGGTASLTNSGGPIDGDVEIFGETSATGTNSTSGEIAGLVSVFADAGVETESGMSTDSSTDVSGTTTVDTYVPSSPTLAEKSVTTTDPTTFAHSWSHSSANTYTDGTATFTNDATSTIDGGIDIEGALVASLTNDGAIAGSSGGVTVDADYTNLSSNESGGASGVRGRIHTYDVVYGTAGESQSADTQRSSSGGWSHDTTETSSPVGGAASLTNGATATIGSTANEADTYVTGQTLATASNAGTIFGDLNVTTRDNYTGSETDNNSGTWSSSSDHSWSNVTSIATSVTTDVVSRSNTSNDSGSSLEDYTSAYEDLGGAASVDNSGEITGDLTIDGLASATGTNSGTIDGSVYLSAAGLTTDTETGTNGSTSSDNSSRSSVKTYVDAALVSVAYSHIDPTSFAHSWASSDVVTVTAGTASFTNTSGTVSGDVTVSVAPAYDSTSSSNGGADGTSGSTYTNNWATSPTIATSGTDDITTGTQSLTSFDSGEWSHDSASSSSSAAGGTASFDNPVGSTIGVSGGTSDVSVSGQSSATAVNAGTIYGGLSDTAATSSSSSTHDRSGTWASTNDETLNYTYNDDFSDPGLSDVGYFPTLTDVQSATSADTRAGSWAFSDLTTGGVASFTNDATGDLTDYVDVEGPGSATVDNFGMLGSDGLNTEINVLSIASNSSGSGDFARSSSSSSSSAFTYGETLAQATTTTGQSTATATSTLTGSSTSASADSNSRTIVHNYTGGTASLTNEAGATIGTTVGELDFGLDNITVNGLSGSTLTNKGTIYANATVGGSAWASTDTETHSHVRNETSTSSDSATSNPITTTVSDVGNFFSDIPSIASDASFDDAHTVNVNWTLTSTDAYSGATVGGPASYIDSAAGALYGSLGVTADGGNDATATVNGFVGPVESTTGSPFPIVSDNTLSVVARGGSLSTTSSNTRTGSFSGTFDTANPATTPTTAAPSVTTSTTTETSIEDNTASGTRDWTAAGGAASLNVNGTVGFEPTTPITVTVDGIKSASLLVNSTGQINGNVTVESNAANWGHSWSATDDTTSTLTSTDTETVSLPGPTTASADTSVAFSTDDSTGGGNRYRTQVGGAASALNFSNTITGDLTVSGFAGALVHNFPGAEIWGNVTIDSQGTNSTAAWTHDTTTSTATTVTLADQTVDTTYAHTHAASGTTADKGGDATLTNEGTLGDLITSTHGVVSLYNADGLGANGSVIMNADGNVIADNTSSGTIYGSLTGTADGTSTAWSGSSTDNATTDAVTTFLTGITVTNGAETTTDNHSRNSTHTGGTASLVNDGSIGQSFASAAAAGGGVTEPYGVYLAGDAGASILNNGLIGGDAEVTSDVSNENTASSDTSTDVYTQTTPNAATDTQTITDVSGHTWSATSAGGPATITNSATGTIGADVLNGASIPVGSDAEINADGDAGATITNAGLMQGDRIAANSYGIDQTALTTDNYLEIDGGVGLAFVSSTDVHVHDYTSTPTSGTASIDNSGEMIVSAGLSPDELDVDADAYTSASVTNELGALIVGDVYVDASGDSIVNDRTTTETDSSVAGVEVLDKEVAVQTSSDTYSGGTGSLMNAGEIDGNVDVTGFTQATATNTATGVIDGNVEADSIFSNTTRTTTVTTYGPGFDALAGPGGIPVSTDTVSENDYYSGGSAVVDNSGYISGTVTANGFAAGTVINEAGGSIIGDVDVSSFVSVLQEVNNNGVVTEGTPSGGTATATNLGTVDGGFDIVSWAGSTLTNAADAEFGDGYVTGEMSTYSPDAMNSFTNTGTMNVYDGITFVGNTNAINTGYIDAYNGGLTFNSLATPANDTFTFGKGSFLEGNIYTDGTSDLTLNFVDSGVYEYDIGYIEDGVLIDGATATNKTGPGTWILTGEQLGLGATNISDGMLEIGYPDDTYINDVYPYYGTPDQLLPDPFAGNTAVNYDLNGQNLTSGLTAEEPGEGGVPIVSANFTIGTAGALEGSFIDEGSITNSGAFLAGYMLPSQAGQPLGNLLNDGNLVLPGEVEVSGDFTQTDTGTTATNFVPAIVQNARYVYESQSELFAPVTTSLSVSPFTAPTVNPNIVSNSTIVVDGAATVAGTVKVYVDPNGLYVDGQSETLLTSVGTLTSTATTAQSQPSLFVGFGLDTGTATTSSGTVNTLNVVVDRTSYASVAANPSEAAVGRALDSAVPVVAAEIAANDFASVADFNTAQDMAQFLSDMDWNLSSPAQGAAILGELSPSGYSSLAALDTGTGFRNMLERHLTEQRGGEGPDPTFGFWGQGYAIGQTVDGREGAANLSGTTGGLAGGWDVQINNVVVGIGGGYARTTFDTNGKGFDGSMSNYQVGVYGDANFGQFYVDGTIWGNFGNGNATRNMPILGRVAKAAFSPDEFRFDAEGGYRFQTEDNVGITPYVAFGYRDFNLGSIRETGAGGLGLYTNNASASLFTPALGVTVDGNWMVSSLVDIRPLIGGAVAFGSGAPNLDAQFEGGGTSFLIRGASKNSVMFKPEVGMDILLGPSLSMQLGYQGAFGDGGDQNGGYLGLRANW